MRPTAAHCRVKSEEGDVQIAARPLHFIGRVSEAEVGEITVAILNGQRDSLLVGNPFLSGVDLDADGNHALVTFSGGQGKSDRLMKPARRVRIAPLSNCTSKLV